MENMPWLGPLKQFALVWFFLIFSGILIWTFSRRNRQLEELRYLPFEGEVPDPDRNGGPARG